MHILCNIIQVTTISDIFFKCTSCRFIINFHLPFKILNVFSMHIIVEDFMKFQFVSISDSVVILLLNGQYIQGLTGYTTSPINSYDWNLSSIQVHLFFSLELVPSYEDFMPIQTYNFKTCNMVQQYSAKLLNEMTSCNNNLLCLL